MIRSTIITGEGLRPHRVVLYKRDHIFEPWVVHYRIEEDGSLFHGSYVETLADAAREFYRRVGRASGLEGTMVALVEDLAPLLENDLKEREKAKRERAE